MYDLAVVHYLRVVERLLRRQPRVGRDVSVRDEELHPPVRVALAQALRDERAQPLQPLRVEIRGSAQQLLPLSLLGQAQRRDQRVEEVLNDAGELQPLPVAGRVRIKAHSRRPPIQPLRGELGEGVRVASVQLPVEQARHLVRDHPPEQAGLHELSAPVALARQKRGNDAGEGGLRRGVRCDGDGRVGRAVAVDLPLEHQHASALRRHHRLVAAVAGVRPRGAEAGDRAIDQRGVGGAERLVVGTEAGGDAGPVGCDHNVGVRR